MLHIDRIHSKSVRLWGVNPKSIWSSECLCYILSVVLVIACYIYHESSNREIRKKWVLSYSCYKETLVRKHCRLISDMLCIFDWSNSFSKSKRKFRKKIPTFDSTTCQGFVGIGVDQKPLAIKDDNKTGPYFSFYIYPIISYSHNDHLSLTKDDIKRE